MICAAHWQGQGKTSGISIDVHRFDLYEFRDGRVIRAVVGFRSKNEALFKKISRLAALPSTNVKTCQERSSVSTPLAMPRAEPRMPMKTR